jgi:hypothetical protein
MDMKIHRELVRWLIFCGGVGENAAARPGDQKKRGCSGVGKESAT